MANYKRKKDRTQGRNRGYSYRAGNARFGKHHTFWTCHWPASWDIVFHTRPTRRANKAMTRKVLAGHDPDGVVWPLSKKPHKYYW